MTDWPYWLNYSTDELTKWPTEKWLSNYLNKKLTDSMDYFIEWHFDWVYDILILTQQLAGNYIYHND